MKLTVIGAGTIGAGVAYNVALRDVFDEIVIIDLDEEKAKGEALDISHATSFYSSTIEQGDYKDAEDSDVVAFTAGKPREEGMSRTDLLEANVEVVKAVFDNDFGEEAVFVTTTNPMDVINYSNYLASDYPRERFIGFGGLLDSLRMQHVLSEQLDVERVKAYVIGEHGDSQVPVFSQTRADGKSIGVGSEERENLREKMRESAMEVIKRKGGTQWAPTFGVAEMIEAVVLDQRRVFTCSAVLEGEYGQEGISIGVPCVIGSSGVENILEWELSDWERDEFESSAERMEELCDVASEML